MPRFVILEHDHPALHWDLMLESGDVLRTWRLSAVPEVGMIVAAEPTFDHRKMYLDYEGPISGGRGTVRRWDSGTYEPTVAPQREEETKIAVELAGKLLQGRLHLRRTSEGAWTATYDETRA
jgi:hypothetical protein